MTESTKTAFVIFLSSLSALAYEIALIRIFSISLWYHFAFMIISIAMLGIGASGTFLSLFPRLRNLSHLGIFTMLAGGAISLSYVFANQIPFDPVRLSWEGRQLIYVALYYLTLSAPFFFTGLLVATAFSSVSEKSGLLYAADLLGAGSGSLGALFLMSVLAPDSAPFVLSSIVLLASFTVSRNRLRMLIGALISLNMFCLFAQPPFVSLRMSPYKGLESALRFPGAEHLTTRISPFSRVDTFKSPAVRFAPGLSLRYTDPLPEQVGISIDGGDITAITDARQRELLSFLTYLPAALPYETTARDDVLILDPKGGLQVLVAEHYGSHTIYRVESNPLLLDTVKRDFKDYSGGIYESNSWPGLGRSWLRTTVRAFDIIDIPLMGPVPSGAFGIAEDYRFTVEALKEYLDHLKPGGVLSFSLYLLPPPRIELRLLSSIITALEESGAKDVGSRLAAIRSWGSITILAKKTPFSRKEIEAVRDFSRDRRFDLVHYPGISEEETNRYVKVPSNEYFRLFRDILNAENRKEFIESYLFDVRPVHDDAPFFHHYLKLRNLRETYRAMGEKWQYFIEEGYILPAVFVQVLLLSLVLIVLPATAREKVEVRAEVRSEEDAGAKGEVRKNKTFGPKLSFLSYFALLGAGFMFVEIVLVQKMILPLENPPYAVATVLTSILISSGLGSLLSHRVLHLQTPRVVIVTSFIVLAYSFLLPVASNGLAYFSIAYKIAAVFLILLPLGLFMGIPFPMGLKLLGQRDETLIPWAWAINGCLSVLAPILTVMLAMVLGFQTVLWLGGACYLMAFVTLRRFVSG